MDVSALEWVVLAVAAMFAGLSKTALNGIGILTAAMAASVLPAGESTGVVLVWLIASDVVAIRAYHAHADWQVLRRLAPAVVVGILIGAAFVSRIDMDTLRRAIGAILLVLVVMQLVLGRGTLDADRRLPRWLTNAAGVAGGFTSMLANAGGPVMSLYLLNAKSAVLGFLGTTAWLFFAINLFKLPLSIGLGLLTTDALLVAILCLPMALLGTWLGLRVVHRLSMERFKQIVLVFTALASLNLLR